MRNKKQKTLISRLFVRMSLDREDAEMAKKKSKIKKIAKKKPTTGGY